MSVQALRRVRAHGRREQSACPPVEWRSRNALAPRPAQIQFPPSGSLDGLRRRGWPRQSDGGWAKQAANGSNRKSTFDDPTLQEIARQRGKSAAHVMLRWHLQEGRSAIPKSTKPARIAENFDVFDFELSNDQLAAIEGLDTEVRRGPDPDSIALETYGKQIPEADE